MGCPQFLNHTNRDVFRINRTPHNNQNINENPTKESSDLVGVVSLVGGTVGGFVTSHLVLQEF